METKPLRFTTFLLALLCLAPLAGAEPTVESARDTCGGAYAVGVRVVSCDFYLGTAVAFTDCDASDRCHFWVQTSAIANTSQPGYLFISTYLATSEAMVCLGPDLSEDVDRAVDEITGAPCGRNCATRAVGSTITCDGYGEYSIHIPPGGCGYFTVWSIFSYNEKMGSAYAEVPFEACRQ